MLERLKFSFSERRLGIPLLLSVWAGTAAAQGLPGIPGFNPSEIGRCGGTKTMAGHATCLGRVEKLPQNQSLNLLNVSGQIIRQEYYRVSQNPSEGNCQFRAAQALQRYPDGYKAYMYYHRDSNFLGMPDGDGHCHAWVYKPSADRLSVIYSVLSGALLSQLPTDISPIYEDLTARNAAAPWKANGIQFQHFGVNVTESSDVCLKKVNEWRQNLGAAWSVWSHQGFNCFGVASQYSFAE
ncbi:MAG TPA: hypothetical protein VFO10_05160 [Oligoflexus sp.]|uniref:hypothetical protein n=1 Tax=Oligoflexus sp. TaxID=1971216 RepID=UPI002D7F3B2E|nr:hypothetical protein [Oligoflexus sp.]HET9236614.1 hypothetical protein [Oligoflexus sp.]